MFEDIKTENLPNLFKNINLFIHKAQQTSHRISSEVQIS